MLAALIGALTDGDRRCILAERGRYAIGTGAGEIEAAVSALGCGALIAAAQYNSAMLARMWRAVGGGRAWPGRSEALLAVARALHTRVPESEYRLPEDALEALLERARRNLGRRVPVRGARRHKGRVGDGVERLLVGG